MRKSARKIPSISGIYTNSNLCWIMRNIRSSEMPFKCLCANEDEWPSSGRYLSRLRIFPNEVYTCHANTCSNRLYTLLALRICDVILLAHISLLYQMYRINMYMMNACPSTLTNQERIRAGDRVRYINNI